MRQRPAVELAKAKPPAADYVPNVERWCSAAEVAAHTFASDCPTCSPSAAYDQKGRLIDCDLCLRILTWRRWSVARVAWLERHGIPQRDLGRTWPNFGVLSVVGLPPGVARRPFVA